MSWAVVGVVWRRSQEDRPSTTLIVDHIAFAAGVGGKFFYG
jgi:hypothetical protein